MTEQQYAFDTETRWTADPDLKNGQTRKIIALLIDKTLTQAFFSTSPRKLKDEKTQNSRKKLKVLANLVKINTENKANQSKMRGN